MRRKLLTGFFLLFFVAFFSSANAQRSYSSAVGLRLGSPVSVTYKQFISDTDAFELIAGFRNYTNYNWISAGAAYQKHNDLSNVTENLSWYYGGGFSAYFWSWDDKFYGTDYDGSNLSFGLQGYIGLDYKVKDYPVNISLDWVPTLLLGDKNQRGFGADYGALAVRYILN